MANSTTTTQERQHKSNPATDYFVTLISQMEETWQIPDQDARSSLHRRYQEELDALIEAYEQDGPEGFLSAKKRLLNKSTELQRLFAIHQQDQEQAAEQEEHFKFLDFKDLRSLPKPEWMVYDVLPTKGINFAYGKPGCGKTFFATSVACSIGVDESAPTDAKRWMGRATKHGDVVYIAAEDIDEVAQRVLGWAQYHEVDDIPNLHFFPCTLDLARDKDRFVESLERQYPNIKPVLFVVDTLAMCSLGVDENSKKEFDAVIRSLEELWRKYNCCILAIHHAGNNGDMRGTSSMDAVAYSMISLVEDGDAVVLKSYKKRRGKKFDDIYLERKVIETSEVDEMGEPVTTCVLIQTDKQSSTDPLRLTKLQRDILQHTHNLGSVDVSRKDLIDACQIERSNEKSFVNAISGLINKGLLIMRKEKQRTYYSLTELAVNTVLQQLYSNTNN